MTVSAKRSHANVISSAAAAPGRRFDEEDMAMSWRPYLLSAGMAAAVFMVRMALDPILADRSPLLLFVPAVLGSAILFGVGPAIATAAMSVLAGVWGFINPHYGFGPLDVSAWANIGAFVLSAGGIIAMAESARHATRAQRISALGAQDAAAAARASEARLRTAAEVAGFGTYDWDTTAGLHVWSRETYRIYGFEEGEVLTDARVLGAGHPDDAKPLEALLTAPSGPNEVAGEFRILRDDGAVRIVRQAARVTRDPESGRVLRITGAVQDITEAREAEAALRRSEARYRMLFESIDAGFSLVEMIFDAEGAPIDYRFVETNPAFERQTGLVDVVGRTVKELIPTLEPFWIETYGRVAVSGVAERFEHGADVLKRWFDVYAVPVGEAAPYHVGILFNDISERRRAEEEARRLNRDLEALVIARTRRLEELVVELDAFAYSISHDLRAPLRAIEGFARILNEDYAPALDPAGRALSERIAAAARRMDLLIQDLLTYSRLSRGDLRLTRVDLERVVEAVLRDHAETIEATGADVLVERPMPPVRGNETVIGQILVNLVSNALKFVRPDVRPRLRVGAERLGGAVRLWVEDNGIGVEPAYRERVFQPFEQLHGRDHYSGTGIGLAIVRKGAERLGGAAGVEPNLGGGSRFWVELPSVEEEG